MKADDSEDTSLVLPDTIACFINKRIDSIEAIEKDHERQLRALTVRISNLERIKQSEKYLHTEMGLGYAITREAIDDKREVDDRDAALRLVLSAIVNQITREFKPAFVACTDDLDKAGRAAPQRRSYWQRFLASYRFRFRLP